MSKATLEMIAKLHAKLSDQYEALAAEADEADEAPPPKASKGKAAAADELDDDVPPPKSAGKKATAAPAKKAAGKAKEAAAPEEADVLAAAVALIKATDRNVALKVLKKFGAAKVAELEEDDYAKAIAALEAAMPSEDAATDDDDI